MIIWTRVEEKFATFLEAPNDFDPPIIFNHEHCLENIPSVNLKVGSKLLMCI